MSKYLVVFDIDGTLTQTEYLDSEAYAAVFMDYFRGDEINSNWHEYRCSTDSGLAIELFKRHVKRSPSKEEIQTIKGNFFTLLESNIRKNTSLCQALPGAGTIFSRIALLAKWNIAIATGCWRDSALIKLKYAGLPYHDVPLACGDDHIERQEVINIAIERAKKHYQQIRYAEVVYIGDKYWDYKASQELGIKFIGIGKEFIQNALTDILIIENYLSNDILKYLNNFSIGTR